MGRLESSWGWKVKDIKGWPLGWLGGWKLWGVGKQGKGGKVAGVWVGWGKTCLGGEGLSEG